MLLASPQLNSTRAWRHDHRLTNDIAIKLGQRNGGIWDQSGLTVSASSILIWLKSARAPALSDQIISVSVWEVDEYMIDHRQCGANVEKDSEVMLAI